MHELPNIRGLNVRQMLDLLAVVDHEGVTPAAKALNVSQPALTRSIRQLEETLGVPLLEREGRGVVPTRFGISLARHARTIEAELRHATRDLEDLRTVETGHLVVGASPVGSAMLMGPALARLRERMPGLAIVIRSDGLDAMFDRLERGEVDIIVGSFARGEKRERLVEEVLFQNPLSVIVRASHPLTRRAGLDFADLADQDWIMTRGSAAIRELIANEFRFEGMDLPPFAVETDDVLCIRSLLLSGNFVNANPAELFGTEIERGVLRVLPIRWHGGTRPIGFTLREHGTITPAMAAFIRALREVGREIADGSGEIRRSRQPSTTAIA